MAKATPAYSAGFRAALATVVPLLVDRWFGTGGGAWMSLAGLNGALIDRGGPYRLRAVTMAMLAVASSVTVLVAEAVGGHLCLAGEHTGGTEGLEPIMAFLVYTRRFASSTAALALVSSATAPPRSVFEAFAAETDTILDDLADAVTDGRRPVPFPAVGTVGLLDDRVAAGVRTRLNRLARQLRMLHDAVDRWMALSGTREAMYSTAGATQDRARNDPGGGSGKVAVR